MKKGIFVFLALFFFNATSIAGGPFFVDPQGSGLPLLWENNTVRWIADSGPLSGRIDNKTAMDWVREIFTIWQGASLEVADASMAAVVDLKTEYIGNVEEDITAANYMSYINAVGANAVIIFDPDGEIIDLELGKGAHYWVVGFASPVSDGTAYFAGGIVVINGLFVNGDELNSPEIGPDKFKAAILHEVGHLLNLDHTQANFEATEFFKDGDASLEDEIPTMYPILYTEAQLNLHADDVIALAQQYPAKTYTDNFCNFAGELINGDGKGLQGADVVARAVEDAFVWSDVRTFISGVNYPAGSENGQYVLGGMLPNRKYTVSYRAILHLFTDGANIAPYDPPKTGIASGIIGEGVAVCTAGGGTSAVADAVVDEKPDEDISTGFGVGNPGGAGGCSLIRKR